MKAQVLWWRAGKVQVQLRAGAAGMYSDDKPVRDHVRVTALRPGFITPGQRSVRTERAPSYMSRKTVAVWSPAGKEKWLS